MGNSKESCQGMGYNKTSEIMTTERAQLLIQYIERANFTAPIGARVMKSLVLFLNDATEITVKGYRKYRKEHASRFLNNEADYIVDFLRFNGIRLRSSTVSEKPCNNTGTSPGAPSKTLLINEREIDNFLNYLQNRYDYSPHTLKLYKSGISFFFCFSKVFSNESVREYIKYLEGQGYSPKTIHARIVPLKIYSEYKGKKISIKAPKIQRSLSCENVMSEKEYRKLLDYLIQKSDKKYYLWVRILATTGLRLSEFLQLTWSDVLAGEKLFRGKGNKYREIFFQKQLVDECKKYIPKEKYSLPVAYSKKTDQRVANGTVRLLMYEWSEPTGISKSKLHPHAFRHFFAKQYLKVKNDPIQLAELLGHSSLDTTRLYLQKSKDEQRCDFNKSVTW